MEIPKTSPSASRTLLDEESENKCIHSENNCSIANANELINERKDNYTSDVTDLENSLQRDDENGFEDFAKTKAYIETNNETLNEESVCENIKTFQLESTPCLKKTEEKIIHALNESTISGNTSSDEEILQTRFPVQSKSYEDEFNSFISSASFSDKENFEKKDPEIIKNPIIIRAEDYNKKLSVVYNTANTDSEVKQTEKSKHQEIATDITSYNSLSVETDNSKVETESSYMKSSVKSINEDLNVKKRKGENGISLQHALKTTVNTVTTFDQKIKKIHDISADTVIEQFFNGSFDISALIPKKKSALSNGEKTITKQNHLLQNKSSSGKEKKYKDKVHKSTNYKNGKYDLFNESDETEHKYYNGNDDTPFSGSSDISTPHLKRKISGKYIKHSLLQNKYSLSKEKKYNDKIHKSSIYKKKKYGLLNDSNETEHKKLNDDDDEPFFDSTDILTSHLKRKISGKDTENSKKVKTVTKTNKSDKTDINLEILNKYNSKTRPEKRNFEVNSQHKHMNNQSQYSDKQTIFINDFDIKEKKSRSKNNIARTKSQMNEKIIKDFSYYINPIEKSRSLRNSSLLASKRIKEIEKFENADSSEDASFDSDNAHFDSKLKIEDGFKSRFKDTKVNQKYRTRDNNLVALKKNEKRGNVDNYDEIILDSDNSCFDSQFETIEDSFKSIFKNTKIHQKSSTENIDKFCNIDIIDITSTDSFQVCSNKEENSRIIRRNKKNNKKFEDDTFDDRYIGAKCQLKIDNKMTSKYFNSETTYQDCFIEGNEDTYENNQNNRRKMRNESQGKKDGRTKKLLDCIKNIDKNTSLKNDTKNIMNCGAITRSKKRTWEALEKELLGESSNASFSNEGTKTVLLKEQSARKRHMKEADLYPILDKSIVQTVSMLNRKSKYDKKNKAQNIERRYSQTSIDNVKNKSNTDIKNMQAKEIVAYKNNNILEKTIAAMERCTAKFIAPQKNFAEKKSGLELNDTIDEITIDQEAEFHSNMTFKTNKNEQYYKNEIVAFVKQSSLKKNANLLRKNSRGSFSEAGHLVKQRIVTESYLMKNNAEENLGTESQGLISLSEKNQTDPWSRLIEALNLDGHNEKKGKNEEPRRKSLECHKNSKQYTNAHKNSVEEMQLVMDLDEGKTFKHDKKSELEILKEPIVVETPALSIDLTTCSHFYAENCFGNAIESRRNIELHNKLMPERIEKAVVKKITTKREQTFQVKKGNKSPKFKLQVENGGVKFKRYTKSLSSSSKESVKRKNTKHEDNKFLKNQPNSEKEKYKQYLYNLFDGKDSLPKEKLNSKKKPKFVNEENSFVRNPDENKNMKQTKIENTLIAKNKDDVFSVSSSDSEGEYEKHPGTGLLCDLFDE